MMSSTRREARRDLDAKRLGGFQVGSLETNFNSAQFAKIGLNAITRQDRIETGAGAGRDNLTRLQAASLGGLLVDEPQQNVQGVAKCAVSCARPPQRTIDRHCYGM